MLLMRSWAQALCVLLAQHVHYDDASFEVVSVCVCVCVCVFVV